MEEENEACMCVLSQGLGVEPACRKPHHSFEEFLLLFASGQKRPGANTSGGNELLPHTGHSREEGNLGQSGLIFKEMSKLLISFPVVIICPKGLYMIVNFKVFLFIYCFCCRHPIHHI